MLSNNGLYVYVTCAVMCYIVLVVNSNRFQILRSYTLLLKPPVLMCMVKVCQLAYCTCTWHCQIWDAT